MESARAEYRVDQYGRTPCPPPSGYARNVVAKREDIAASPVRRWVPWGRKYSPTVGKDLIGPTFNHRPINVIPSAPVISSLSRDLPRTWREEISRLRSK